MNWMALQLKRQEKLWAAFVNLKLCLLMRFDGFMHQDLADFASLLPEFSSSDRNLTVSQGKKHKPRVLQG